MSFLSALKYFAKSIISYIINLVDSYAMLCIGLFTTSIIVFLSFSTVYLNVLY
ncbi:hypothetical protein MHBO_003882, partial [Bonamia ostreae]